MMVALTQLARKFGPMMVGTASAQLISAVGLLIVAATLLPATSDMYVLGLQLATAPISGVVLGVVYNATVGRPDFGGWWFFSIGTAAFAFVICAAIVAFQWIGLVGPSGSKHDATAAAIVGTLGAGGLVLSSLGVFAVRDALLGRPLALATLSLPSNLAMIAACVTLRWLPSSEDLTVLPALAWSAAAVAQGILTVVRSYARYGAPRAGTRLGQHEGIVKHVLALAIGAVTATVFPTLYVAIASQLAAGTATIVFIAGRVGAAGIGLVVNAVLTVQYRWSATRSNRASSMGLIGCMAALPVALLAWITHWAFGDSAITYALVVIFLFCLLAATAIVLRELNAALAVNAMTIKSIADLTISVLASLVYASNPTVTGYFGAFAMSQAISLTVASFAFRSNLFRVLAPVSGVAAFSFILFGW